MQWARIIKLSILLTVALAAALAFAPVSHFVATEWRSYVERPRPIIATPEQTRDILAAVLAKEKFEGEPPPPPGIGKMPQPPSSESKVLILADRSTCFSEDWKASDCEQISLDDWRTWPWLNSFAPAKLRRELMVANQEPHDVALGGLPLTKVGSSAEIEDIFAKGGWWKDFYAKYPGSSGYARMSIPVLTSDGKQALEYVGFHCGGLCGVGLLFLMERSEAGWQVVKVEELWVS
jgi:hypothetical protein